MNYIIGIIIGITFIGLILMVILFIKQNKESNKKEQILLDEIIKLGKNQIIIGRIDKYKDEDIERLKQSPDYIKIIMSYLEYNIAKKTDGIRTLENTAEKVGYLNALHDNYMFFYKMLIQKEEDKKYTGQNLQ